VESMAKCQSLDRDGATAVTELSSSDSRALKSGGNPLPTAHDVITLTTARGGGGAVIADLGMTAPLAAT